MAREKRKFCVLQMKDGKLIEGEMTPDGLVFIFPPEIIRPYLDEAYPTKDKYGWYFNATKDRYVAENDHYEIVVNPSFVRTVAYDVVVE